MSITNTLSKERFQFTNKITKWDIKKLASRKEIEVLQTSEANDIKIFKMLNDDFFSIRPDVQLRLYGYYQSTCDLSIVKIMSNVERFSADCLIEAKNIDSIISMSRLKDLSIGVYKIQSFEFLNNINPDLEKLSLMASFSKKPKINMIDRFKKLKNLYLEGQQKGIEVISKLANLETITLRSISTEDMGYLIGLNQLYSVDIKLGGIRIFDALTKISKLKYLEIWQVKKFSNTEFIANLLALQYLFMQSLVNVVNIPSLSKLKQLRRIYLGNMKSLKNFTGIAEAPCLEEFLHYPSNETKG